MPGEAQDGDCFLNYDDRASMPNGGAGSLHPVSQLSYFEHVVQKDRIATTMFNQTANCYANRSSGLVSTYMLTPEACAQVCVNDACCTSFDTGKPGTDADGQCRVAHTNEYV